MIRIAIIGAGPGEERYLTLEARDRITGADLVLTTHRLFDSLSHLNRNMACLSLDEIPGAVSAAADSGTSGDIAILVSGDSGFHSLAKTLPARLRYTMTMPDIDISLFSGISSMQYLCAKTGISYDDAKMLSLHGKARDIVPYVSYYPKVFVLTGGTIKAHTVITSLASAGLGDVYTAVGTDLGSPAERIVTGKARKMAEHIFPDLSCLLILNENCRNPHEHLEDGAFLRGKTPMTKNAVRTLALAALNIQPGDTVADIGAGTGSVSIAMARKAFEGNVFALERDNEALELLERNRLALGAFNMTIVRAEAPDGLDNIRIPDKAFIGGSGGRLADIVRALFHRNNHLRLAVTAITLENLHQAMRAFQDHNIVPDISCVNAAIAQPAGAYTMMKAENPVYILTGGG